jgi:hypothetical protein
MNVENAQNRVGHPGKVLIEKCSYPQLLRHKIAILRPVTTLVGVPTHARL